MLAAKEKDSGALSTLVRSLEERAVIREIESAIGVDAHFPPALCKDLLRSIIFNLGYLGLNNAGYARQHSWSVASGKLFSKISSEAEKAKKTALAELRGQGLDSKTARETLEKAQPSASIDPYRYPIPAFLMEHREDESSLGAGNQPDHSAIQHLFFMALINNPDKQPLNHMAIVLRRSLINPCSGYSAFVEYLPPIGSYHTLLNLQEFISERLAGELLQGSAFAAALCELAELVKLNLTGSGAAAPEERVAQPPHSAKPGAYDVLTGDPCLDSPTGQSANPCLPEDFDSFAKGTSEDLPELSPEEALDAKSRRTRRWEARLHRSTTNDYACLTPIERRRLTLSLVETLQSPNKLEADGAAAVFLMYVTGMQLDDLLAAQVGERGDFSFDGRFRRSLRLPADAYKPPLELEGLFETYQDRIELQLPAVIVPWMRERLAGGHETLLQCMGGDGASVRENVALVLDRIRDSGRFQRIRAERISAALALELASKYQDPTVTFFLSGRANHEPPMLSYYVAHSVEELARRYLETVHQLLQLPVGRCPDTGTVAPAPYSGYVPTADTVHLFREGLLEQFRLANLRKESIVKRHNAFTSYCVGLLMLCTGHRPTRDPFSSLSHFDLDRGLLLICDKATDQARAWRLVALPKLAAEQMRVYLSYLPKLAAHLQQEHPVSDLPQRIRRMTEGEENMLPLFFLLTTRKRLTHSPISESTLAERWSAFWPLPVNFLRHILATRLLQLTNRADYVQLQLGHVTGADHPLGQKATEPTLDTMRLIGSCLEDIVRDLGWSVVEHKFRLPALGPASYRSEKLEPMVLGPALRLAAAKQRGAEAGNLIKQLTVGLSRRSGSIQREEFEELRLLVDEEAMEQGLPLKLCRRFLAKYISRQRGGKTLLRQTAYAQVEPEPSPFSGDSLSSYRELTSLRVAFAGHLDRQGRSRSAPTEEERLVEIIFSAALFGGVADPGRLRFLWNALQTQTYRHAGRLFVDIPVEEGGRAGAVTRWYPDRISASLIEGYYKIRNCEGRPIAVSERGLQKLLALIGRPGEKPLIRLADSGKVGLIMEAPGYVAAAATNENPPVSLKLPAWIRTVTGQSLTGMAEVTAGVAPRLGWVPDLSSSKAAWSIEESTVFLSRLKGLISQARSAPRTASKGVKLQQKRALSDLLRKAADESPAWPALPKLLVGWAVQMCQHGTSFKADLAYATIDKYLMLAASRLCPAAAELGDFLALDAEGYQRLYLTVVKKEPSKNRFELARQLHAFHAFGVEHFWLDEVEWSAVMAAAGENGQVPHPDANYITSLEFQRALRCVLQDEGLSDIRRWQYASLLMWGYRFGLRFGEAFRLQYQDIQYEGTELYLWIRNTLHGEVKTASSKRVVGLKERLTDSEAQVLENLLSSGATDYKEDRLIPLMRRSAGSRELFSRSQVVLYLSRLLKAVTGDERARFHHLRHGWVTRQVGALAGVNVPGFSEDTSRPHAPLKYAGIGRASYPLLSISIGVGHASEATTLRSYTHCMDQVASKYNSDSSTISDFAIAYAEQVSPDTPRRRKARGRASGRRAEIPSPDVQTFKRSVSSSGAEMWKPQPLGLTEVDRLLRRFSVEGQPLEVVALHLSVDIAAAQSVVARAIKVETLSGYRGYRLAERSNDPVARAAIATPRTEKLFDKETARMQVVLRQLETALERMSSEEQREFFAGIRAWLDSTRRDLNVCIVADSKELHALASMAGKLGASAAILVGPGYDVELLKESKMPVTVFDHVSVAEASGIAGRLGVKLRSSPEIGSHRSLRRLLFLLATFGLTD